MTSSLRRFKASVLDPFGFADAFADLSLAPEDLPSITRESRLAGMGS